MVGIFTNINKDKNLTVTQRLIEVLKNRKQDYKLHKSLKPAFTGEAFFDEKSSDKFKLVICVGGDGTILGVAPYCAETKTPIIGINLGNLGFLAEVEAKEIEAAADAVLNKEYIIEERAMLKAQVGGEVFSGLNEIVISRENEGKMISLEVSVSNQPVDIFNCDGYIVSTPTGSTAYSLSAGGPILSPGTQAFSLTPVNSHSLYSRPIIIRDSEPVSIRLLRSCGGAAVFMDGIRVSSIRVSEKIIVSRAENSLLFLRLNSSNFYSRLFTKLNRKITINGETY